MTTSSENIIKEQKTIPNFFVVGFPRSGTSSLYSYLKDHPDIYMSKFKEPIYFCKDLVEESQKFHDYKYVSSYHVTTNEEDYLKFFDERKNEKAVGEASGWYIFSEVAAQEIYNFNPDSKIIILIREPCQLLYSLHHQYLYSGNEDIKDFKKALESEDLRKQHKKLNKNIPWPSLLYYSEIVKFTKHIQKFKKVFPENQIKLVLFDDFKSQTSEVYKEILDFLGVDNSFQADFTPRHSCKVERFNIPNKLGFKKFVTKYFPRSITIFLSKILKTVNTKYVKRAPLDQKLKNELMQKYKNEVEALGNMLNQDLVKLWGYDQIIQ